MPLPVYYSFDQFIISGKTHWVIFSVAYLQVPFERVATKILKGPGFTLAWCDWGEGGKKTLGGWTCLDTIWGQAKRTAGGFRIEAGVHKRSRRVTGRFGTSRGAVEA